MTAQVDGGLLAPAARGPVSARRRGAHDRGSLLIAVVGGTALLLWVGTNTYRQDLLDTAASYALIGVGVYIPFVMGGSLSLAYAAYAEIGGYSVALFATRTSLPLWIAWFIGPLIAGIVAVILGQFTRRLSGFYLVAITYLFSQAFQTWLNDVPHLTGGQAGLGNFRALDVFGWRPSSEELVVAAVLLVIVVALAADRMRLSAWGITLRAMRDVPEAVEAAGVRVPILNLVGLGVGAGVGALGGALFTSTTSAVAPGTFTLDVIFLAIFMSLLGGTGTPWGAVAGAVIVVELTLNLPSVHTSGNLLVALAVIVVMLLAPNGVVGKIDSGRHWVVRQAARRGRADA
jgi:branched-chain amino acid transport system permease protein